ncbi:hypothetical protein GCM10009843_22610 [Nocardioides bigeumensis]|uniref:Bacteriocin biosynthesis cyclodehydratase domain-containing protein n=2 Tax=Nocardioides bigeumensis TaxID=433657 RepID=A0ABN2YDF9_9ACTN
MLRPGSWVSRRDADTLQVGLDRRVVLADTPETRAVLARLEAGMPSADLAAAGVTASLAERDLLVDDADARRGPGALLAAHGPDATRRLRARQASSVTVRALDAGVDAAAAFAMQALAEAGVAAVTTSPGTSATVALVLASGEPDRDLLDDAMAVGQPHVLVSAGEGAVRLGPFVVPGSTACQRCLDAELAVADHRRGVVLAQVAGRPGPVDAATTYAAVGLAVRDVLAYLDGDRPMTWSATLTLVALPGEEGLVPRRWRRHPHCGCCWDELMDLD